MPKAVPRLIVLSLLIPLALAGLLPLGSFAEEEAFCSKQATFDILNTKSPDGFHYAPDRKVDILHIHIDVTPDFENRTISGTTVIRFAPIALPLEELALDAIDLSISEVSSSADLQSYDSTDTKLKLTFAEPIPPGQEVTLIISHKAEPKKGVYFRTPDMGYKEGDTHLFTQGETHEASHWFPCYDFPNEKSTTEVTCRVPQGMIVLANGRKTKEEIDAETGLNVVTWLQDKPHVTYLIALCAGYFERVEDNSGRVPMAFYTPPSSIEHAPNSFRYTNEMMDYFEEEIGVSYPWDRYDQVVVDDFPWGGMENTTMTVLSARTFFTDEFGELRNSESLVAHELTHQWFGDYLTCKDWSHLWLNEGFATYYDRLFHKHKHGEDSFNYRMLQDLEMITGRGDGPRPIVNPQFGDEKEQFGYRSYQKGSWVLHMLRSQLGTDLYRKAIQAYAEENAFKTVVSEDLNRAFEKVSGRSFDRFFYQWIYHGKFPELKISYEWLEKENLAKVTVKQEQETGDKVALFQFPVTLRFKSDKEFKDHDVYIREKHHDFFVPLDAKPEVVWFDPDLTVLAKIDFDKPKKMLYAQLVDPSNAIGRILACRSLSKKDDKETVKKLKEALETDDFYGVRVAASKALREIKTEKAREALLEAGDQPDARVRNRVESDIAAFFERDALSHVLESIRKETNPGIVSTSLKGLGKYSATEEIKTLLEEKVRSDSFMQTIARGALAAIKAMDDPSFTDVLIDTLRKNEREYPSRVFASGLETLAYINRTEDDRSEVREFLIRHVNHKKENIRTGSLRALGTLRDPKAIPVVESFTGEDESDRISSVAKGVLKKLHEAKKTPVEMSDLRNEVLELKDFTKEMKKQIETLEKKFELKKGADPPGTREKTPKKKGRYCFVCGRWH